MASVFLAGASLPPGGANPFFRITPWVSSASSLPSPCWSSGSGGWNVSGTLDSLPHNGAVVTLFAVCGVTHRDSYLDIVMVGILGALVALVAVIVLGTLFGSF